MGRTGVARAPAEGRSFTCAMGVTFSYHASKLSSTSIPIDFWITTRSFEFWLNSQSSKAYDFRIDNQASVAGNHVVVSAALYFLSASYDAYSERKAFAAK
ncbi:MAG: hypothetical protein CBD47_09200 [Synechococcus sp. TMED187]|jgi:hypothetical protein|nr:MAG: hypothetical protein CBD47_09200 [Synechococcus sp. TMED187]